MDEIVYLSLDDVIALHDDIMRRMANTPGVVTRPDLLDAAIHRPRNHAFYNPDADLIVQAIVLAVGISQAQAFLDGSKRAAFAAADMFLLENGLEFAGDPVTFACWLICVAGRIRPEDIDLIVGHLGLDLAAILDGGNREEATRCFEDWLRANVTARAR